MLRFKVIRNDWHGFTMTKLCLTCLIVFHDEICGSVDKAKAVDVICFDFSKALHSIFVTKLVRYALDR